MHHAPCIGVERVAPVHHATIVPEKKVALAPMVRKCVLRLGRMRPQQIEQLFALGDRQAFDVTIAAATEKQGASSRHGVYSHERMA